jgi:hypothetical protein
MSTTNVFSSDFYAKPYIEREMEYSATTRLPLRSIGIIYPSPSLHITLTLVQSSLIFTCTNGKDKGLTKTPFLAINAKGGESIIPKQKGPSISPKQKDRTTTNFKFFEIKFSIGIFQISIPLKIYLNWYLYFKLI